jgi:phosphohistidine phosphatase
MESIKGEEILHTTNEEDQRAVSELRKRISIANTSPNTTLTSSQAPPDWTPVSSVSIDEGQWKYVLISATEPYSTAESDERYTASFVTSKRGASYHKDAAEPYVDLLQSKGYRNINVSGGGRIYLNLVEKKINIFGHSYGFGLADHASSKKIIQQDERFKGYDIEWSNDGY